MKHKCVGLVLGLTAGLAIVVSSAFAEAPKKPELLSFKPSNLQWEKTKADFVAPNINTCGGCHNKQYREWQGSMHAMAFQDPIYLGELNLAIQKVGKGITKQCEGCHTAAAFVKGETENLDFNNLSPLALAGVSCDVCHSIKRHTHWETPSHEPENGSYVLSPGRENADGSVTLTKYGPIKPYENCGGGFHECVESPLFTSAELCAGCHHVFHYEEHTPFEHTYAEWKGSMYAVNDIQCQDCHMVDIDTFKRSADSFTKPKRSEYHHYFNGANFLMYFLGELKAKKEGDLQLAENLRHKYKMAVERLQSAAEIDVEPIYNDKGELYKILVRVHNRRAGHNLPTSLTNIRQMWLEVLITDQDGKEILKSGYLDEKGALDKNTYIFNSDGMGYDMSFQVDPWEVVSYSRHDTIPPKGHRDVYYTTICSHEEREIKVHAKLRFRQASQYVAEKLLSHLPDGVDLNDWYGLTEIPAVPVVDMVEQNLTFSTKGTTTDCQVQKKGDCEDELYHKLGGAKAVDKAIDLMYKKVLADDRLNRFFKDINITRQRRMMNSFLAFAFNGPDNYKWKGLKKAHNHLVQKGLSGYHFDLFVGHMKSALKEIGVEDELINEVCKVAMSKKKEVLGRD